MKQIPLTQGAVAIVDDKYYQYLNQWKWNISGNDKLKLYAVHTQNKSKKKGIIKKTTIYMHKLIMNCPSGKEIDHINGNSLDNRRENLRITDHKFNGYNLKRYKNNKSGFKGVYHEQRKVNNPYQAHIRYNKKLMILGYFPTAGEAAIAYNNAALKYHGEFANLNSL